jgi:hypothetical protein
VVNSIEDLDNQSLTAEVIDECERAFQSQGLRFFFTDKGRMVKDLLAYCSIENREFLECLFISAVPSLEVKILKPTKNRKKI